MKKSHKIIIVIALSLLAFISFTMLSSYIFSKMTAYKFHPLIIVSAYKQKVEMAKLEEALIYASTIFILLISATIILFKKPNKLYGVAKLSTKGSFRKNKMLAKDPYALIVGKSGNQFIYVPGINHLGVIAGTGLGKGVSFVIPNLLHFEGSALVIDVKGENHEITSGWRASKGQSISVFDPAGTETHRFNPFSYLRGEVYLLDDLQRIANILVIDKDPTWRGAAIDLFIGMSLVCLELAELKNWPKTIPQVYRLLKPSDQPLDDFVEDLLNENYELSDAARANLIAYIDKSEKTRSSILFTLQSSLSFLDNKLVQYALSGNDFDLGQFRKKAMTLYIVTPALDMKRLSPVFRLLFEFFLIQNQTISEKDPTNKIPTILMLDEMARLGNLSELAESITFLRAYGIMLCPVLQYPSQLDEIYGKEKSTTLLKNLYGELILPPNDVEDAEIIAKKVSYTTVKKTSYSFSKNGKTKNVSDAKGELIKPNEILQMGKIGKKAIFLHRKISPAIINRVIWHEDDYFKKRHFAPHPKPNHNESRVTNNDYDIDLLTAQIEKTVTDL